MLEDKKQTPNTPLELNDLKALAMNNLDPALIKKLMELLENNEAIQSSTGRWQDQVILNQLPRGSSVLDLGCGDGELLSKLIRSLDVQGQGVELDPLAVVQSIDRGVPVLNFNLDTGLGDFADRSFDYVILESTLQTLREPIIILNEMLRVGHRGIISFPNFGHWRVRLDLAIRGRMPVTNGLPYTWYNTPNIHLFTLKDFMEWCQENQVKVTQGFGLTDGQVHELTDQDNLSVEEALLFLEKIPQVNI